MRYREELIARRVNCGASKEKSDIGSDKKGLLYRERGPDGRAQARKFIRKQPLSKIFIQRMGNSNKVERNYEREIEISRSALTISLLNNLFVQSTELSICTGSAPRALFG